MIRTPKAQPLPVWIDFYPAVEAFQRCLIISALQRAGGIQTLAAELLNMRLSTLNQLLHRLGGVELLPRSRRAHPSAPAASPEQVPLALEGVRK